MSKTDTQVITAMANVFAALDTSDDIKKPRKELLKLHDLLKSRGYGENVIWTEAIKRALNV